MKKVETEVTDTRVITRWFSDDGKEFMYENMCQDYEDYEYMKNVQRVNLKLSPFVDEFYYIDSKKTLEVVFRNIFRRSLEDNWTVTGKKVIVGDWVAHYRETDSDGDYQSMLTLLELKEAIIEGFK